MARGVIKIEAPELRVFPDDVGETLDWSEVFGRTAPVEIEIGMGKGRFILAAAAARPEIDHFTVEWANRYLRIAEARAKSRGIKNIRFIREDARRLMAAFPTASVDTFYVFYPDPWPKKRHQKRRFLREDNAAQMARILRPGGKLHVATDHAHYWSEIEPLFDGHPDYERQPEFGGEGFPADPSEPLTNFEAKYLVEGRDQNRGTWIRRGEKAESSG